MDRDVIIYIVFAIVYFVIRSLKKKPKLPDVQDRRSQGDDDSGGNERQPSAPPMSFEDLLRELTTGGQKQQEAPAPKAIQPAPAKSRSFEFPSDGTNYEDVQEEWADKEIYTVKEGNNTRIFSDQESKRIYQESMHIDHSRDAKVDPSRSRFAEFEIQEDNSSAFRDEIVDMLSTQDGAKKAIILSEILDRKY